MSTKRGRDPAGLLPDSVQITLDGHASDASGLLHMLRFNAPAARIERLRRHVELKAAADDLAQRYRDAAQRADRALLCEIAQAEHAALYMDAAPAVTRSTTYSRGQSERARKPRAPQKVGRIIGKLAKRDASVKELWPEFIGCLDSASFDPVETEGTAVSYETDNGRRSMSMGTFANRISRHRK